MSDSYKIYASKDYVDSKALPDGAGAYQQLVTDANGEKKWENRTHYLGEKRTLVFPEYTYTGQSFILSSTGGAWTQALSAGQKYAVIYNGTEYTGVVKWNEIIYTNVVGNESLNSLGNDTGEPFFFNNTKPNQECFLFFDTNGEHTISVYLVEDEIHSINEEYLPTTVPVIQSAQTGQTIAVKTVDDAGKPTEWEATDIIQPTQILFVDASAMVPGLIQSFWSVADIIDAYRSGTTVVNFGLEIVDAITQENGPTLMHTASDIERISDDAGNSGYRVIIWFGEEHAPIIVNGLTNTITLDPDWVAPTEPVTIPDTPNPHMQLVTDTNGEKKWEERLAYNRENMTEVFSLTIVSSFTYNSGRALASIDYFEIKQNAKYRVAWDGVEYVCIPFYVDGLNMYCIGNTAILGLGDEKPYPFLIAPVGTSNMSVSTNAEDESHTIGVVELIEEIVTIPDEYIPPTVPAIQSATAGQIIAVKSIDENGKPTEWETIDPWTITSPNGTQFKLTIDDEGILSATELV